MILIMEYSNIVAEIIFNSTLQRSFGANIMQEIENGCISFVFKYNNTMQ